MQRIHSHGDEPIPFIFFQVTRPSEWLFLRFDYGEARTWSHLQVRDPQGRLRFSHMDVQSPRGAVIHRNPALTSRLAVYGDIGPGEWRVDFIRKPPVQFTWEWSFGDGPSPETPGLPNGEANYWIDEQGAADHGCLNLYDWERSLRDEPGWYKGDLHEHTILSDGKMTPEQNMAQARMRGLDYFFVTDHNVLPTSWPAGEMLVIPAMEFTSFGRGDWNALGLKRWIDCWGSGLEDGGMKSSAGQIQLLEEAEAVGAIRSVCHPVADRFAFRYPEVPLSCVDLLEIMNSPASPRSPELTERALKLWNALWNDGYRIPGVGGSDAHYFPHESYFEGGATVSIGDPATFIYAERLSAEELLKGIRKRHVYVSRGPVLEMRLTCGGKIFMYGDDLTQSVRDSRGGIIECVLTISGAAGKRWLVIEKGECIDSGEVQEACSTLKWNFSWSEEAYTWRRFEVRDAQGALLAYTSPFFCGAKSPKFATWGEIMDHIGFSEFARPISNPK